MFEALFGFVVGLITGFVIAAICSRSSDRDAAKAGVMRVDDKAYKVTPIN